MFFPQAVFRGPLADQQRSPRGGGGGGGGEGWYSSNIWVLMSHLGFEKLTLFRTKKILNYIPCLESYPQFCYPVTAGFSLSAVNRLKNRLL